MNETVEIILSTTSEILIVIVIVIIIREAMVIMKNNKKLKQEELEKEESLTYTDLEKELEEKYKKVGIEWDRNAGINSVYLSLLKKLINEILKNIDGDVEEIINSFRSRRCRELRNVEISLKFNKLAEPINFAIYFQEENIQGETLREKIKKLALKYCKKAADRVKDKIEVELKYNNKEAIKKVLEEMLKEL